MPSSNQKKSSFLVVRNYCIVILLPILASCSTKKTKFGCEFDYFEKTSGINFPKTVEIIDCNDNPERIIWVSLKFDSKITTEFIKVAKMNSFNNKIISKNEGLFKKSMHNQQIDHMLAVMNDNVPTIPRSATTYLSTINTENQHVIYIINKESGFFGGLIEYPY